MNGFRVNRRTDGLKRLLANAETFTQIKELTANRNVYV